MRRILSAGCAVVFGTAVPRGSRGSGSTTCCYMIVHGMLLDHTVVLALQAAQEFEKKHKADDADAETDKHACRGDVPCPRYEARVEGIPIPEHLS